MSHIYFIFREDWTSIDVRMEKIEIPTTFNGGLSDVDLE